MAVVAGMKKPNDHAEPTKSRTWKKTTHKNLTKSTSIVSSNDNTCLPTLGLPIWLGVYWLKIPNHMTKMTWNNLIWEHFNRWIYPLANKLGTISKLEQSAGVRHTQARGSYVTSGQNIPLRCQKKVCKHHDKTLNKPISFSLTWNGSFFGINFSAFFFLILLFCWTAGSFSSASLATGVVSFWTCTLSHLLRKNILVHIQHKW